MKVFLICLLSVISTVCLSQDCKNLPTSFSSYSAAITAVKNASFAISETANTTNSSWITSAEYYSCDGSKGYFIFSTNDGYEYIHKGVPISVWRGFKSAASKGTYYTQNIKGRYQM